MVNNQNEITMQNLYDVALKNEVNMRDLGDAVSRIDSKLDSSVETLNSKIDSSINASEERMKTYTQTYVEKEFDDFAIIIGKSFAGSEERMKGYVDKRFDKIETRLDKIELSTPCELEKRIMVVEEDSDLHDTYFRGFRKTLEVV